MGNAEGFLRSFTLWSHKRGTLPYDIICALILAFIFFVPRGCFVSKNTDGQQSIEEGKQAESEQDAMSSKEETGDRR